MKKSPSHGRDTVLIHHMSLSVNTPEVEAHSLAPFLVRAKWSFEPFIKGDNWDEPDTPEYFAFESLYVYEQAALFLTEEGVLVTVKPYIELTSILNEAQLKLIEDALREGWKADNEVSAVEKHKRDWDVLRESFECDCV